MGNVNEANGKSQRIYPAVSRGRDVAFRLSNARNAEHAGGTPRETHVFGRRVSCLRGSKIITPPSDGYAGDDDALARAFVLYYSCHI